MSTRGSGLGVRAATVLSSPGWGLAAEAGDLSRAAAGFPPAMRQRSRPPGLSRPLRRAAIRKDSSDRGEPVMAAKSVKVTFVGAGGETLAARLDLPQGRPRAYALFAPCFTCSKDIFAAARIAGGLAARGFAVLRSDFTGLGAIEGDFANTHFSSKVENLSRLPDFLPGPYCAQQPMLGPSLCGAARLATHAKPHA